VRSSNWWRHGTSLNRCCCCCRFCVSQTYLPCLSNTLFQDDLYQLQCAFVRRNGRHPGKGMR
jgi:hypothetical protein